MKRTTTALMALLLCTACAPRMFSQSAVQLSPVRGQDQLLQESDRQACDGYAKAQVRNFMDSWKSRTRATGAHLGAAAAVGVLAGIFAPVGGAAAGFATARTVGLNSAPANTPVVEEIDKLRLTHYTDCMTEKGYTVSGETAK